MPGPRHRMRVKGRGREAEKRMREQTEPGCPIRWRSGGVLVLLCLLAAAGCATTPEDYGDEGDLPWATPAAWEGAPSIPGMSDQ